MRSLHRVLGLGITITLAVVALAVSSADASGAKLNEAGQAAYARGDYAEAERQFARAVETDPQEPLYQYHRAVALTRLGRWSDARDAYAAALRLRPDERLTGLAREGLRALPAVARPSLGSGSVRIQRRGGVWFADVVLNDSHTARFLVDTGATFCVLSPSLAESLGITPRSGSPVVRLQTMNGRTAAPVVAVSSIRVGDVEANDVYAVVVASGGGGMGPVSGILGNTFLSRFEMTIDNEQGIMTLRQR